MMGLQDSTVGFIKQAKIVFKKIFWCVQCGGNKHERVNTVSCLPQPSFHFNFPSPSFKKETLFKTKMLAMPLLRLLIEKETEVFFFLHGLYLVTLLLTVVAHTVWSIFVGA